ncbi:MAG: hypothetical protein EBY11_05250 [Proteobacteria bacterium]|nr:hypothetical protein [Pseudomonadota bacterium]
MATAKGNLDLQGFFRVEDRFAIVRAGDLEVNAIRFTFEGRFADEPDDEGVGTDCATFMREGARGAGKWNQARDCEQRPGKAGDDGVGHAPSIRPCRTNG